MNVREALRSGAGKLAAHTCAGADAVRDAELLLALAMHREKEDLAREPERVLSLFERLRYRRLVARRRRHAPMAYLTGWAWFHGRRFAVTRATLIPRPATETVLDAALGAAPEGAALVDVGTGTGCVAVTAAAERPDLRVFATDISPAALRVARRNARTHGAAGRITFRADDLLAGTLPDLPDGTPLVIVANLPYLPENTEARLDPDVADNEPAIALFGGPDGLDPSRRLIDQIAAVTRRVPTDIFLELLSDQVEPLSAYATKKIAGLSAGPVLNDAQTPIGVRLTVR